MIKKKVGIINGKFHQDKTKVWILKGAQINQVQVVCVNYVYPIHPLKFRKKQKVYLQLEIFSVCNEVFCHHIESVMKAKILWLLKSVKAHFSCNSRADVGRVF